MGKLRDTLPRGIPHEEFVRRKARLRRIDRGLQLSALVESPGWTGPLLLLGPFPGVAVLSSAATGQPDGFLLGPIALAVLLVFATVCLLVLDAVHGLIARASGRRTTAVDPGPPQGPKPVLLVVTAGAVLVVILVAELLDGRSLLSATIGSLAIGLVAASCFGLGIVYSGVRRRLVVGRRRRVERNGEEPPESMGSTSGSPPSASTSAGYRE